MRKALIVTVVFALAAAVMPAGDAAGSLDCGDTIKRSIRLENSLANCDEHGLIIGASGITIDLAGKTIDGEGDGAGIFNEKGHKRVVVRGGTISGFDEGVLIESEQTTDNTIEDLELTKNGVAVNLEGADGNLVSKNEISGNKEGILVNGHHNLIEENEIFDETPAVVIEGDDNEVLDNEIDYSVAGPDDDQAAILFEGDGNVIADNEILAGEVGIGGSGDDNLIDGNELEGGAGTAIALEGDDNSVVDNEIEAYEGRGIHLTDGAGNVIKDNEVDEAGDEGILVEADETQIAGNDVDESGNDGIEVDADDVRITDNDASDNGFDDGKGYGIIADGDGIEGSDNDARGNANAKECAPSTLCE